MRILSIILTTMTLCFGFTRGAWAGSEVVTPLLLTETTSPFQCIVTNATATKTVSVNVTLFDVFGTAVFEADAVPIGPRDSFIQAFPSSRPLSCVVDVLGGQDASLVRVVLVITDGNDNVISLLQAR